MAGRKSNRNKIDINKPTVIAIEFAKIYMVMDKRLELNYSAYELSFLLGKNDFFVRDVENPLISKRYNPDDTNYLLLIFNERLSSIMLPKAERNSYNLRVTFYLSETRRKVYEIAIKNVGSNDYIYFKDFEVEPKDIELPVSHGLFSFESVQSHIDTLLNSGYFDEPKRALDIFKSCKSHFGKNFHPRNMIRVLNFYTNKKSGIAKLNKDSRDNFGRKLFVTSQST